VSEDKQFAMKIRDSLEEAGVDVFFDKDELHAGDHFEAKLKLIFLNVLYLYH